MIVPPPCDRPTTILSFGRPLTLRLAGPQDYRLIKTPKLHLGDTGLACALLGVDAAGLAADRSLLGQILETFVFQELRRQASWHDEPLATPYNRVQETSRWADTITTAQIAKKTCRSNT